jgi:ATP-dependent DNA ligase
MALPSPPIPSLAAKPPTGPGWVHEIKHDGCRQIASRDGAAVGLLTSQSLETDLTRVVHCTALIRRFWGLVVV